MADRLKIGLIGSGMMGCEHLRNLKLLPEVEVEVEVVALADPTPRSLDWGLSTLGELAAGVKTYADGAAMLAAGGLDAVLISSPNQTHREVLEPVFAAGVHVLCEKPLCTTIADARWAAEQAARHKGVFWTGMEYRFMPPAADFIARVHDGAVGRLHMLSIREHRFPFLPKVGDWNRFSYNTGGTMVEKCCHFFDLMRLITRAEPVRVTCSGAMDVNHLDERYDGRRPDMIDNSFTLVDFDDGARAMLDLCMFADGAEEQEVVAAVGDQAKLEVSIPSGDIVRSPRVGFLNPKTPERIHVPVDETALAAGSHHGATFYQLSAFVDAVRGRGPVAVTAEDGLKAVAMGVAAETSAREKRVVEMRELGF